MDIRNIGYNVGEIDIATVLTDSTKTEIGTPDDFGKIMTIAKSGGVARVNFKISTTTYSVVLGLNPGTNAIAVGGVTSVSGSPIAVSGSITLETGKMYATIGITSLGTSQNNAVADSTPKATTKATTKTSK